MKKLLALLLVAGLLGLTNGCSKPTTGTKPPPKKPGASSTNSPKNTPANPTTGATQKENKDKIVGMWALEKTTNKQAPPPGTTIEFTKDGELKMTVAGQTMKGTYKVEGDKIVTTTPGPKGKPQTETQTINTLTDKELVTKDEKGNVDTFKKK